MKMRHTFFNPIEYYASNPQDSFASEYFNYSCTTVRDSYGNVLLNLINILLILVANVPDLILTQVPKLVPDKAAPCPLMVCNGKNNDSLHTAPG